MKLLEKDYGEDNEFYFVTGFDLIPTLNKWYNYEKLIKEVKFIIMERLGFTV
jgi:nicotinic acid mononucleotide adenylyltransferase